MKLLKPYLRAIKNTILKKDTQTPFELLHKNAFVLVSFPKSGRTWIRLMLQQLGVEIGYTHDGAGHLNKVHYKKLITNKLNYKNNNVIFLMRNLKDTVVSGFFHTTKRLNTYNGTISEFIRNPRYGIEKIAKFNSNWLLSAKIPHGFLLIKYEDLRKNTFDELKKILNFVHRTDIDNEKIINIVEFAKFENMQKLEKEGFFKDTFGDGLTPKNICDIDSYKTRRGKIGGYLDYLTKEDIEYCDKIINKYNL